uniref:type II toxin-antitoxin system PemK/MazF family toxin n=1 Tax=Candidatus Synechococcus spongiarum TaxID=431041 RepID=UPI0004B2AF6A
MKPPSRLQIVCAGRPSEVAVDQIRTLSKERFVRRIDSLANAEARRLRSIIRDLYASEEG